MEKQISGTDRTLQSKQDQASQLHGKAAHWVTERQSQYHQELAKQSNPKIEVRSPIEIQETPQEYHKQLEEAAQLIKDGRYAQDDLTALQDILQLCPQKITGDSPYERSYRTAVKGFELAVKNFKQFLEKEMEDVKILTSIKEQLSMTFVDLTEAGKSLPERVFGSNKIDVLASDRKSTTDNNTSKTSAQSSDSAVEESHDNAIYSKESHDDANRTLSEKQTPIRNHVEHAFTTAYQQQSTILEKGGTIEEISKEISNLMTAWMSTTEKFQIVMNEGYTLLSIEKQMSFMDHYIPLETSCEIDHKQVLDAYQKVSNNKDVLQSSTNIEQLKKSVNKVNSNIEEMKKLIKKVKSDIKENNNEEEEREKSIKDFIEKREKQIQSLQEMMKDFIGSYTSIYQNIMKNAEYEIKSVREHYINACESKKWFNKTLRQLKREKQLTHEECSKFAKDYDTKFDEFKQYFRSNMESKDVSTAYNKLLEMYDLERELVKQIVSEEEYQEVSQIESQILKAMEYINDIRDKVDDNIMLEYNEQIYSKSKNFSNTEAFRSLIGNKGFNKLKEYKEFCSTLARTVAEQLGDSERVAEFS